MSEQRDGAHTPGPWAVDNHSWDVDFGITAKIGEIPVTVARALALGHDDTETRENVNLIASAPDLLEALKKAHKLLTHLMGKGSAGPRIPWGQTYDIDFALLNETLIDVPHVIAKAEGRSRAFCPVMK